jgi:hypothetical protein
LDAELLDCAKDWGIPPWVIEDRYPDWFWKWEYYTSQVRLKEVEYGKK